MSKALWEGQLEFLQRNLHRYLEHWPSGREQWRPTDSAFTLLGLAEHLYGSPGWYMDVVDGGDGGEGLRLDDGAEVPRALGRALDEGIARVRQMLAAMDEAAFTTHKMPWSFGDPLTAQELVLNVITHMYHHRGQFHLYLKQLGQPVNTDTVYAS